MPEITSDNFEGGITDARVYKPSPDSNITRVIWNTAALTWYLPWGKVDVKEDLDADLL